MSQAALRHSLTQFASGKFNKGPSKTKSSHYGILREEKLLWRDEHGTDRGSQRVAVEDSEGSQGQRAPHVHGQDRASSGRRWSPTSRTTVGGESWNDPQWNAPNRSWRRL